MEEREKAMEDWKTKTEGKDGEDRDEQHEGRRKWGGKMEKPRRTGV